MKPRLLIALFLVLLLAHPAAAAEFGYIEYPHKEPFVLYNQPNGRPFAVIEKWPNGPRQIVNQKDGWSSIVHAKDELWFRTNEVKIVPSLPIGTAEVRDTAMGKAIRFY